ncbi:MAG TPA: endolytic transglycosylase MltG [Candidatus Krumholzibacteria bacterium]|nr:endolytic transglycosylase MltG [Candidatus Krumholzibacteria bacterium]
MELRRATAIVVVMAIVAGLGFAAWVTKDIQARGPADGERVRVVVSQGAGFNSVVRELEARGLLRRAWTLKLFARATGQDRRVQRGTYEFAKGTPPVDILRAMVRGDVLAFLVTVPEGFNVWQVAGAFDSAGVDSAALFATVTDAGYARQLEIPGATLEGYLFPDTYRVPFGSTPHQVAEHMVARARAAWDDDHERRAREIGLSRHEVITLASIVEAEARVAEERPTIAAVYHNRLKKGMRLEADPTVAYAMGGFRGRLFYKDLEIDSPYNTYRRAGLPPGPICNPGRASIEAALHPAEGVAALYFVARGDGRHVFSTNLRDHNAAVRDARRNHASRRSSNGK